MEGHKRRRMGPAPADEVTDADVEEFYAILRCIRLASKLPRPWPHKPPPAMWNPSFAPEDFQLSKDEKHNDHDHDNNNANGDPATEVQSGHSAPLGRRLLDLNQHPEPDAVLPTTIA